MILSKVVSSNEEFLDIQSQLILIIPLLQYLQSYHHGKMQDVMDGVIYNHFESQFFFQMLNLAYARPNVVHGKQGDDVIADLAGTIITKCVRNSKWLPLFITNK